MQSNWDSKLFEVTTLSNFDTYAVSPWISAQMIAFKMYSIYLYDIVDDNATCLIEHMRLSIFPVLSLPWNNINKYL